MEDLKKLWSFLREANSKVANAEARYKRIMQPEAPSGRQLPFSIQKTFSFQLADFETQESPVVMSAGQVTEITRLSWFVEQGGATFLRARSRSCTVAALMEDFTGGADDASMALFDFEWSASIGSTERRYTNGRGIKGFNSRQSLGDPENSSWLLFSERNPIVLGTNEFLNIRVRPILYNMDPGFAAVFAASPSYRIYVSVLAEGVRTYGQ